MVAFKDSIASFHLIGRIHDAEHLLIKIRPCKKRTWVLVTCYMPPLQLVGQYNSFLLSTEAGVTASTHFDYIIIDVDVIYQM